MSVLRDTKVISLTLINRDLVKHTATAKTNAIIKLNKWLVQKYDNNLYCRIPKVVTLAIFGISSPEGRNVRVAATDGWPLLSDC